MDLAKDQLAGGIQVSQSDLLQAASSMGPSVSESERRRYQEMYVILLKHVRPSIDHYPTSSPWVYEDAVFLDVFISATIFPSTFFAANFLNVLDNIFGCIAQFFKGIVV